MTISDIFIIAFLLNAQALVTFLAYILTVIIIVSCTGFFARRWEEESFAFRDKLLLGVLSVTLPALIICVLIALIPTPLDISYTKTFLGL